LSGHDPKPIFARSWDRAADMSSVLFPDLLMHDAPIQKLSSYARLEHDDIALLATVLDRARSVGPRTDLIREGEPPNDVHVVLEGYACRYKVLADGGRQIVAHLVAGDFGDLHGFLLERMDHSITTLTTCQIASIPRDDMRRLFERPRLAEALWRSVLVNESIMREWLVSIGRRTAEQQIAHLFCEILLRLEAVGRASSNRFDFPLTQAELGDTLGLSTVHVNRVLQSLRDSGLIVWRGAELQVLDRGRLMALCSFDPQYLHQGLAAVEV
jgi:CRP-like cAMP-binding protein